MTTHSGDAPEAVPNSPVETKRRERAGQRQLLDHIDDDIIREYVEATKSHE